MKENVFFPLFCQSRLISLLEETRTIQNAAGVSPRFITFPVAASVCTSVRGGKNVSADVTAAPLNQRSTITSSFQRHDKHTPKKNEKRKKEKRKSERSDWTISRLWSSFNDRCLFNSLLNKCN